MLKEPSEPYAHVYLANKKERTGTRKRPPLYDSQKSHHTMATSRDWTLGPSFDAAPPSVWGARRSPSILLHS